MKLNIEIEHKEEFRVIFYPIGWYDNPVIFVVNSEREAQHLKKRLEECKSIYIGD